MLAERANSVVWSGQGDSGTLVQVVVLDPDATALERTRFVEGASRLRALGRVDGLSHVIDVDADGRWYVCDDPPGTELAQLDVLEWSLIQRLEFVVAVLGVLHELHSRGLVHGALCLHNLLAGPEMMPILCEVGTVDVALLAGRDGTRLDDYRLFAAPEVCRGESFDSSADVFAVGRLLEHFLIERVVDPGERRTIAFGAYAEFAEALARVVAHASQDERGFRLGSARDMMREIASIAREVRRSPYRAVESGARDLGVAGCLGSSSSDAWQRSRIVERGRPWLGPPPIPAGALQGGAGGPPNQSTAGRSRSSMAIAAMELIAFLILLMVAATLWFAK